MHCRDMISIKRTNLMCPWFAEMYFHSAQPSLLSGIFSFEKSKKKIPIQEETFMRECCDSRKANVAIELSVLCIC